MRYWRREIFLFSMAKFKNKYRIESNRLKGWNYANNGLYFITIVTQNRECNLGHIENNEMIKSKFGEIVNDEWYKSFEMRNELFLHEYILMPNHLHAIMELINIGDGLRTDAGTDIGTDTGMGMDTTTDIGMATVIGRDERPFVSTTPSTPSMPQRQPKSISSFIAGFKSSVNSKIDDYIDAHNLNLPKYNRNNHFFQPNYHDHIIRDNTSYQNIKNYIIENPLKWQADTFHPKNPDTDN